MDRSSWVPAETGSFLRRKSDEEVGCADVRRELDRGLVWIWRGADARTEPGELVTDDGLWRGPTMNWDMQGKAREVLYDMVEEIGRLEEETSVLRKQYADGLVDAASVEGSPPPLDGLAGFVPPFELDTISGTFIWDAKKQMAGDFIDDAEGEVAEVRPRGYGRIKHLPDGEMQMTLWESWFERVVGDCLDPEEVVRRLNAAAGVKPDTK